MEGVNNIGMSVQNEKLKIKMIQIDGIENIPKKVCKKNECTYMSSVSLLSAS